MLCESTQILACDLQQNNNEGSDHRSPEEVPHPGPSPQVCLVWTGVQWEKQTRYVWVGCEGVRYVGVLRACGSHWVYFGCVCLICVCGGRVYACVCGDHLMVCMCGVGVHVWCVFVCVWEREREKDGVCVCVCMRERGGDGCVCVWYGYVCLVWCVQVV